MANQKIAFVYDAIYPYSKGGAERRFYEIGIRLAERGLDVHLYGMKYWDGPNVISRDGLTLHGLCNARPLYTKTGRRSISQALIFGLSTIKLLGQRFDAMDCCGFPYFSLFGCKLAALINRKPLYVTWHEVWGKTYWNSYLGRLGPIGYAVEKLASKLPDHIIAVSEDTAANLKNQLNYRGKLSLIPNGVDQTVIHEAPVSSDLSDLIYVGRLVDFKNVDLLIQAVAKLKATRPDIRCTIVGNGPMRTELEQLSDKLGLGKNIRFTGFIESSQDVYGLMKASKVFVLPSAREGFGISVVEANAAGLPVITTNHPGNAAKHLISEGINGYVATPTADGLVTGILKALKQPSTLAPQTMVSQYDWQTIASQTQTALRM